MKKLIVFGLVSTLLVVADFSARAFAESKLEERARMELPGATVDARIPSFPFLPRLLLSGRVSEVDFSLGKVAAGDASLPDVNVDLAGVQLDRSALLKERKARLLGIGRGSVAVSITAQQLSDAVHMPVEIGGGVIRISIGGRWVEATASAESSKVILKAEGVGPLVMTVPKSDLIPCLAHVTVLSGRLRVTCAIENIPAPLRGAALAS